MAGTAAGAAKATEARKAAAAARREQFRQSDARHMAVTGQTDDGPMTDVAQSLQPLEAIPLHSQAVALLMGDAVDVTKKILRGTLRASPAVRVNAALRVLEMAQKPGAAPAVAGGMAAALSALGRAFALRERTLDAIPGEVVVTPATPDQS